MTNENERQIQIREFILNEAKARAKMLGIDENVWQTSVNANQSLVDSGLYDSLSFLDLLGALENKFGVEVDLTDYELEYFVTIDGLTAVIDAAQQNAFPPTAEKEFAVAPNDRDYVLEEITPLHPRWQELAFLFRELYKYLEEFDLMVPLKENGAALWLKSMENVVGKTNYIVGAIADEKLVGYFQAGLKILPVYLRSDHVGMLISMYVLPEYRKQKIAAEMYENVYQWLRSKQVTSIEAQVMCKNHLGIDYWLERGYTKELTQFRKIIS